MLVKDQVERMPLLNGSYSATEAQQIVNSVLKQYRNLYNLEFMRNWESNHDFDSSEIDDRLRALDMLQNEMNAMIREARETGSRVDIEGLLNLRVA